MASYIKQKLKVLKDLKVDVSEEAKKHFKELKTEIAIDNFAYDLIIKSQED